MKTTPFYTKKYLLLHIVTNFIMFFGIPCQGADLPIPAPAPVQPAGGAPSLFWVPSSDSWIHALDPKPETESDKQADPSVDGDESEDDSEYGEPQPKQTLKRKREQQTTEVTAPPSFAEGSPCLELEPKTREELYLKVICHLTTNYPDQEKTTLKKINREHLLVDNNRYDKKKLYASQLLVSNNFKNAFVRLSKTNIRPDKQWKLSFAYAIGMDPRSIKAEGARSIGRRITEETPLLEQLLFEDSTLHSMTVAFSEWLNEQNQDLTLMDLRNHNIRRNIATADPVVQAAGGPLPLSRKESSNSWLYALDPKPETESDKHADPSVDGDESEDDSEYGEPQPKQTLKRKREQQTTEVTAPPSFAEGSPCLELEPKTRKQLYLKVICHLTVNHPDQEKTTLKKINREHLLVDNNRYDKKKLYASQLLVSNNFKNAFTYLSKTNIRPDKQWKLSFAYAIGMDPRSIKAEGARSIGRRITEETPLLEQLLFEDSTLHSMTVAFSEWLNEQNQDLTLVDLLHINNIVLPISS